MLFQRLVLEKIASGEVTLAFRRWRKPTVRPGGTLRTEVGVLAIESLTAVAERDLTEQDARQAGCAGLRELRKQLAAFPDGTLYRIAFKLAGPDPRIALRETTAMTPEEMKAATEKLKRLDAASRLGPWTGVILQIIAEQPEVRAQDLATATGFPKEWLKTNVRKLKELGLTESLLPGYRLSPRGQTFLKTRGTKAAGAYCT